MSKKTRKNIFNNKKIAAIILTLLMIFECCSVVFGQCGIGDVNGDNDLTMKDVLSIRRFLAKMPNDIFKTEAADINVDGNIDMKDILLIRRHMAHMDKGIEHFYFIETKTRDASINVDVFYQAHMQSKDEFTAETDYIFVKCYNPSNTEIVNKEISHVRYFDENDVEIWTLNSSSPVMLQPGSFSVSCCYGIPSSLYERIKRIEVEFEPNGFWEQGDKFPSSKDTMVDISKNAGPNTDTFLICVLKDPENGETDEVITFYTDASKTKKLYEYAIVATKKENRYFKFEKDDDGEPLISNYYDITVGRNYCTDDNQIILKTGK